MAGADRSALHDVMAQDDAPRFNFSSWSRC